MKCVGGGEFLGVLLGLLGEDEFARPATTQVTLPFRRKGCSVDEKEYGNRHVMRDAIRYEGEYLRVSGERARPASPC